MESALIYEEIFCTDVPVEVIANVRAAGGHAVLARREMSEPLPDQAFVYEATPSGTFIGAETTLARYTVTDDLGSGVSTALQVRAQSSRLYRARSTGEPDCETEPEVHPACNESIAAHPREGEIFLLLLLPSDDVFLLRSFGRVDGELGEVPGGAVRIEELRL